MKCGLDFLEKGHRLTVGGPGHDGRVCRIVVISGL